MTYMEKLETALYAGKYGEGELDSLLTYAYYKGKEDGAREACKRATKRWKKQLKRARSCSDPEMAKEIVGGADEFTGGKGFVYHPDYSGDYSKLFGDDVWKED